MRSQDTTDLRPVCLPFWMAKEVALDLVEKQRLEAGERLLLLELGTYKSLVVGLEESSVLKDRQLDLLEQQRSLLETRLAAEKAKKPRGNFSLFMLLLGALGVGILIGAW